MSNYESNENYHKKSHFFHFWEFVEFFENVWELKLTKLSLGGKNSESY